MEEDGRLSLAGLHHVHTVPASGVDVSATHGQGVKHLVLGCQDLLGVTTDARPASP
jgi:hypothetical protein